MLLRQVHALEHATVWVLSEIEANIDEETLGGFSTERGFYLYGQVNLSQVRRAVSIALQRLQSGETNLAIHPRCGTNVSVSIFLTAGLVLATHLLLPRNPLEQILGLGLATTTAWQLAPDLGISAQKYLTTSIPFNLEIAEITATKDFWERRASFVRVCWQDLQ